MKAAGNQNRKSRRLPVGSMLLSAVLTIILCIGAGEPQQAVEKDRKAIPRTVSETVSGEMPEDHPEEAPADYFEGAPGEASEGMSGEGRNKIGEGSGKIPVNTSAEPNAVTIMPGEAGPVLLKEEAEPSPSQSGAEPGKAVNDGPEPEPVQPGNGSPESAGSSPEVTALDPEDFSTSENIGLADINLITADLLQGNIPDGVQKLTDFNEVTGGWKAYMKTDPDNQFGSMMEHYLNVSISGSAVSSKLTFQWNYSFINAAGQGYDDNSPDSTFVGAWQDGGIEAIGPGRVNMTDFYYESGREYAVGSMMWPDGVPAAIVLIRP